MAHEQTFTVGQQVHAGDPYTEDWDKGVIVELNGHGSALVAWSSGTRTNIPTGMLAVYDGQDFWSADEGDE